MRAQDCSNIFCHPLICFHPVSSLTLSVASSSFAFISPLLALFLVTMLSGCRFLLFCFRLLILQHSSALYLKSTPFCAAQPPRPPAVPSASLLLSPLQSDPAVTTSPGERGGKEGLGSRGELRRNFHRRIVNGQARQIGEAGARSEKAEGGRQED